MPSVTSTSEWDNDYARVVRVASQLRTEGGHSSSASVSSVPQQQQQRQRQRQLLNHLLRLDSALATLPISSMELQRRRRLIQHLQHQHSAPQQQQPQQQQEQHSNVGSNYHHFGASSEAGGSSPMNSRTFIPQYPHPHPHDHQSSESNNSNDRLLLSAKQQQDSMIDELAMGVGRLRDQTQVIHDESTSHVRLLHDMERNVGTAHAGLEAQTQRATKLKEDTSVWRLQLIIVSETVLFVLLLLQGIS